MNPVPHYEDLANYEFAKDGDACYVYADPEPQNNGIWVHRAGQWEFAPGGAGGNVASYQDVLTAGGVDALQPRLDLFTPMGGTIFLQAGEHHLRRCPIIFRDSYVRLLGEGPATRLVIDSQADVFFQLGVGEPIECLEFQDLTIHVKDGANAAAAVIKVLDGCQQARFKNVRFEGVGHHPFVIHGAAVDIDDCTALGEADIEAFSFLTLAATAHDIRVRGCVIIDFPVVVRAVPEVTNLQLTSCLWQAPVVNLVTPKLLTRGSDFVISGCQTVTTDAGVVTEPVVDCEVNSEGSRIIADSVFHTKLGVGGDDITVLRNTFHACDRAITCTGDVGSQLSYNRIHGNPGAIGLITVDGPYTICTGNVVHANGGTALHWRSHYGLGLYNRVLGADVALRVETNDPLVPPTGNLFANNLWSGEVDDIAATSVFNSNMSL